MTGIIPIDKPGGALSRRISERAGRLVGEKKAGHAGTLDPLATGVLPVMLGRACRLLPFLDGDKRYTAKMLFGVKTDTADVEGAITEKNGLMPSLDNIALSIGRFVGEIWQLPPLYSAVKKAGRPLYDYARRGEEVCRQERAVSVYGIELIEYDELNKTCTLDILCGAGTYIRTLCEDIASRCGAICALASLRRTLACSIAVSDCIDLAGLEESVKNNDYSFILKAEEIFENLSRATIPENGLRYYLNGGSIGQDRLDMQLSDEIYRVYSQDGRFLGLGGRVEGIGLPMIKSVWLEEI